MMLAVTYKILYKSPLPTFKPIEFPGSSLDDLRAIPLSARREAGYQIDQVQSGLDPDDWKPMNTVGQGVREIRVRDLASKRYRDLLQERKRLPNTP